MGNNDVSTLDVAFCKVTIQTDGHKVAEEVFKKRCEERNE